MSPEGRAAGTAGSFYTYVCGVYGHVHTPLVQQPGLGAQSWHPSACVKCSVIHKAGWWSRGRKGARSLHLFLGGPRAGLEALA